MQFKLCFKINKDNAGKLKHSRRQIFSWKKNEKNSFSGASTNCDSVLRSIDRELVQIETALDVFQALVEKEKTLLEQGEVHVADTLAKLME